MFIGRFQTGQEVPIRVQTYNSSREPALPTAAPTYSIYKGTSNTRVIDEAKLPIQDRYGVTANFLHMRLLNSLFSAGTYMVVISWANGGSDFKEVQTFEIVAGGDDDGAVIAMREFVRPHAKFIVQQLDSGKVTYGRNPSV